MKNYPINFLSIQKYFKKGDIIHSGGGKSKIKIK
jgi:hypothetical protein